jgi:hypothetical protein
MITILCGYELSLASRVLSRVNTAKACGKRIGVMTLLSRAVERCEESYGSKDTDIHYIVMRPRYYCSICISLSLNYLIQCK